MVPDGPDTWMLEIFAGDYKQWLIKKMRASRYAILFDVLHDIEFTWIIDWDENRASDGIDLRVKFEDETGIVCSDQWLDWPCSVLEMLVALAYSIEDRIMYDPPLGDRTYVWFWDILDNLGLTKCTDNWMINNGRSALNYIDETIQTLLGRGYDYNGHGGMFPLKKPEEDQRNVELWYQANAYFLEKMGV